VIVMRDGRIVEDGPRDKVLGEPRHPYTRALLDAAPRLDGPPPPCPVAAS
jgi:ABC-type dipeptide/oligopeptide/nickel transport system ATPase component